MADYDICITPVKRASFDVGRKMRFYDDAAGETAAVVKNLDGDTLTQPIKVPADGHLNLRFDQWPVYYADNRQWARIKRLPGMPATIAGIPAEATAVAALGVVDLDESIAKADVDDGGTIDGTEIAAYLDALHTRVNLISDKVDELIAALVAADLVASA